MASTTFVVLIFTLTAGALIWMSRDVDRRVSNRAVAQSVAFQSARAAAQQLVVRAVRVDGVVVIDRDRAVAAANSVATSLFEGYQVTGRMSSVSVTDTGVVVQVVVNDSTGDVIGIASARAVAE
jgi:hypothetical protein